MARATPLIIARSLLTRVAPIDRIALARDLLVAVKDPLLFAAVAEAVRDADLNAQALARRAFGGPTQ
jgi:hypothetical protein